jgi:hypothetical protein
MKRGGALSIRGSKGTGTFAARVVTIASPIHEVLQNELVVPTQQRRCRETTAAAQQFAERQVVRPVRR